MGGIACVTPPSQVKSTTALRPRKEITTAEKTGQFGQVPIKPYKKPTSPGLRSVVVRPLELPDNIKPTTLDLAKCLDALWRSSYKLSCNVSQIPSWSGFMQMAVTSKIHVQSRIVIPPFINQDPTNPSTIYSALCFAQRLSGKHMLGICPVTFDQPLFLKALEIVIASPDLTKVCIRLGGFHLLMSYMGSIGYVIAGSGLDVLWETLYAPNTVVHMLSGHAYARALRAHIITIAALTSLLLDSHEYLETINVDKLQQIHTDLLHNSEYSTESVTDNKYVQQLSNLIDELESKSALQSRTARLWINYLHQARLILLFLRAERTGDWKLHMYSVRKMIPLFHSAGHLAYAKSTRLYVQQMDDLSEKCQRISSNSLPQVDISLFVDQNIFGVVILQIRQSSRN